MDIFNAPTTTEGNSSVNDVKPGITSLDKVSFQDRCSSLFEAASGCILHRYPNSVLVFQIYSILIKKNCTCDYTYSCLYKNAKLLQTWVENSNMHSK